MNWDEIAGRWNEHMGRARERWGRLTDDDLQAVEGQRDQLIGKIQHAYGTTRDEAEKQIDDFLDSLTQH